MCSDFVLGCHVENPTAISAAGPSQAMQVRAVLGLVPQSFKKARPCVAGRDGQGRENLARLDYKDMAVILLIIVNRSTSDDFSTIKSRMRIV